MRVSFRNSSGRRRLTSAHGSVIEPGCPGGNSTTLCRISVSDRMESGAVTPCKRTSGRRGYPGRYPSPSARTPSPPPCAPLLAPTPWPRPQHRGSSRRMPRSSFDRFGELFGRCRSPLDPGRLAADLVRAGRPRMGCRRRLGGLEEASPASKNFMITEAQVSASLRREDGFRLPELPLRRIVADLLPPAFLCRSRSIHLFGVLLSPLQVVLIELVEPLRSAVSVVDESATALEVLGRDS